MQTQRMGAMRVRLRTISAMGVMVVLTSAAWPAPATDAPQTPISRLDGSAPRTDGSDPVLAIVNGLPIRRSELIEAAGSLPRDYQNLPLEMVYPVILDRMIDIRLIGAKGRAADLDQDPEVRRQIYEATEKIIEEVYLTRYVEERVTDAKLRAEYDRLLATLKPAEEVKVRHILVGSEARARELIAELKDGKDFAELARTNSLGPEAARGGELGFIGRQDMVRSFTEAAFALDTGAVSDKPVRTEFGWHVIKQEERRTLSPPSFEEMRPTLVSRLSEQIIREHIDSLRQEAAIQRFDLPQGSGDVLVGAQQTPFGPLKESTRVPIRPAAAPSGTDSERKDAIGEAATASTDRTPESPSDSDPVRPPPTYRPSVPAPEAVSSAARGPDRDDARPADAAGSPVATSVGRPAVPPPAEKPSRIPVAAPALPPDIKTGDVKPPPTYKPSVPARDLTAPSESEKLPSARVRLPLSGGDKPEPERNGNPSGESSDTGASQGGASVRLK